MARDYYYTSEIAHAVNVHPNTVRQYESWGYLPAVPRTPAGYRKFTDRHLDQVRLVRMALQYTWFSGSIRYSALEVIAEAAAGDFQQAMYRAKELQLLIHAEQAQAERALRILENWLEAPSSSNPQKELWIGAAATLLNTTIDTLRAWERNGLIAIPRNPHNGYRRFGPAELDRLRVIDILRKAGYSTMAMLRMFSALDGGSMKSPRRLLNEPGPFEDDDAIYATDRWLSTLFGMESTAQAIIALIGSMQYHELQA